MLRACFLYFNSLSRGVRRDSSLGEGASGAPASFVL